MIQLLKLEIGHLDIGRFFHGHKNVDKPVSNDLNFRFPSNASSFAAEGRLPVAGGSEPAVILALQKNIKKC